MGSVFSPGTRGRLISTPLPRGVASLPVDSQSEKVRISALFTLKDGSQFFGHVASVPKRPSKRSPHAIIGEHFPVMLVKGKSVPFWCLLQSVDDVRGALYGALRKGLSEIFPIHFEGASGLATGIVSGEIEGFYEVGFEKRTPPRIVR